MIRIAFLFIALLASTPADAGCFLFFCSPRHHHHAHHRLPRQRIVVQHKTIVKKIIIVRERAAHAPAVALTPITPLK